MNKFAFNGRFYIYGPQSARMSLEEAQAARVVYKNQF